MIRKIALTLLFIALTLTVFPALAGSTSINGATTTSSPKVSLPASGCSGLLGATRIATLPFYVDTTGSYNVTFSGGIILFDMLVYQGSFDPAQPSANCIFAENASGDPNYNLDLSANTAYILVAANELTTEFGSFTGSISGPGNVFLGAPSAPQGVDLFIPGDERINHAAWDRAAPVAIYCKAHGIQVWKISRESGRGWSAPSINLSFAAIDEQGIPGERNMLLAEQDGVQLYRLTTGEFQVNVLYEDEYKWYIFVWDQCMPTRSYHLAA